MRSALRSADVLDRQMRDYFVHRREVLPADLLRMRLLRLDPEARHLLLHRLSHVAEEGTVVRRVVMGSYPGHVMVMRHELVRVSVVLPVIHVHVDAHVRVVGEVVVMVVEIVVEGDVLVVEGAREDHRVRRGVQPRAGRRPEVVMLPPQQEVPRRVARVRIQMTHRHAHVVVAVVEPVHVLLAVPRRQVRLRRPRHAVRRRRHLQPHARQVVVVRTQRRRIHKRVQHFSLYLSHLRKLSIFTHFPFFCLHF